jgi:hypothetical protein
MLAILVLVISLPAVDVAAQQGWNVRLVAQIPVECKRLYVEGKYAYLGKGRDFQVLDISKPTSAVSVGHLVLTTGSDILNIHVSGGLAYLAAGTTGGLQIIDVTNPALPKLRGSYHTSDSASGVFVAGGLAYVAVGLSGLEIIDVTNPPAAKLRGACLTRQNAYDLSVSGGLAYVADSWGGLVIVDVSNPAKPFLRSFFDSVVDVTDRVFYSGGVVYMKGGLFVPFGGFPVLLSVDVRNPDVPVYCDMYESKPPGGDMFVSSGMAYSFFEGSLKVFDLRRPLEGAISGSYGPFTSYNTGLFASGDIVYAAMGAGGLWILQYTGPRPVSAAHWTLYR